MGARTARCGTSDEPPVEKHVFRRNSPEVSCKSGISGFKIRVPRRWTLPEGGCLPRGYLFLGEEDVQSIAAPKRVRRNDEIDAREVRLDRLGSGDQRGVMSFNDALEIARDEGLDLVEVSPNADPPVCRIMDFGKYLFEQNKKGTICKSASKSRFMSKRSSFVRERTKVTTRSSCAG